MPSLCKQCGFNNPPGMRFCGNCGARLAETAPPVIESPGADQLGEMVGADLQARFENAGLQASGQRRNVTVLFADLSGYTHLSESMEAEILYEIVQKFVKMLANAVYKYDGMVDKFTGDGLMALFGAPIAHENNAERANHAALDMAAGLVALNREIQSQYGFNLEMHIGINSGTVIVGSVGSDRMMDYTAIGETVNMAQRLEAAAGSGRTLVSESVYRQTRMLFDYQVVSGLSLKGITHPVVAYSLLGEKVRPGSVRGFENISIPMVGRQAEMQQLESMAEQVLQGRLGGAFAIIKGEAGIGKSRLVAELLAREVTRPALILQGRSLTYRRAVPYWMFQDVLRTYLGVTVDTPETQVWEQLQDRMNQVMGAQAEDVLPYLDHLMGLLLQNQTLGERFALLEADQLRQQIFLAVRHWLEAEARIQPVILVLDDLHWADEASLGLMNYLLESLNNFPIMLFGISRPFSEGELADIAVQAQSLLKERYLDITLSSLLPDQSEQLFYGLLAIPDIPTLIKEKIIQTSDGIPFYLEEILRMLIDDQVICYEGGHWRLHPGAEIDTLGVPENLEALILARFDRLDLECRRVLQVASVIGRDFGLPVLSCILPQEERITRDCLTILEERAFLVSHPGETSQDFSFRHVLTSDAIYRTLLKSEKQDLHGKIGTAIESLFPDRITENTYLLARHFAWSQYIDKALHYLIVAGEQATRDYLITQARTYFERARDLLPKANAQPVQALQTFTGLGDVMVFIGEYEQARQYYAQAQEYIDPSGEFQLNQYGALLRKISTTYERQGNFPAALENLESARLSFHEQRDSHPVEMARNLSETGWINFRQGNFELAEKHLQAALSYVDTGTQFDVIASIYNRLGGVYFQKDDLEQASNFVRKSLVLREEIGDTGAVARSYNNLGLLAWKRGEWNAALDNFSHSFELNRKLGDVEAMIFLNNNIGLLQTDLGNLDVARRHLDESLSRSQQVGHTALMGETYLHFSRYWLAAQEWEKSLFYSQRALDIFQDIGAQERLVDLYASMGEAWLGLGDIAHARQSGESALKSLAEYADPESPSLGGARILRLMGNIDRTQKDYQAARSQLKASIQQLTALKNHLELGRSYVDLYVLEREVGNLANARIHAREARLVFRKLGANLDLKRLEAMSGRLS